MGSGDFYNVYGVNGFHLTAGQKDYEERLVQMENGVKQYYRQNGIPPGVPTQKGSMPIRIYRAWPIRTCRWATTACQAAGLGQWHAGSRDRCSVLRSVS